MDLFPLITLLNQWPGHLFLQPNSYFQSQARFLYEDGRITSYPQNTTQYDTSTHYQIALEGAAPLTSQFLIRGNLKTYYQIRKIEDEDTGRTSLKSSTATVHCDVFMGLITDFQAELAIGIGASWVPKYTENLYFGVEGKKNYPNTFLANPQFAINKKGGGWSAGFFYHGSSTKDRKVQFVLNNGSEREVIATLSRPSAFGLMANFSWLSNLKTDVEAMLVQASQDTQKGPDGKPIYRDYGAISTQTTVGMGSYQMRLGLSYKDGSYAEQAGSELPTLSQTGMNASLLWGSGVKYHIGVALNLSGERQSLPELNAKMSTTLYGIFAGLNWNS